MECNYYLFRILIELFVIDNPVHTMHLLFDVNLSFDLHFILSDHRLVVMPLSIIGEK